jgi:hypothetical protein
MDLREKLNLLKVNTESLPEVLQRIQLDQTRRTLARQEAQAKRAKTKTRKPKGETNGKQKRSQRKKKQTETQAAVG